MAIVLTIQVIGIIQTRTLSVSLALDSEQDQALTCAGLDEYLWWCEDMGMAPVLAVWDGKSYGGILSGSDLEPFLDDIMNEMEVSIYQSSVRLMRI
jgi:alpha-N-arabinofuranosidase